MDNIGGYLGDTNNGIGQGLAFVLPKNNTAAYAMQLAQQHAKDIRDGYTARQKAQELSDAQYAKEFAAQKLPELQGPSTKLIVDNHNKYLQDAAAFHSQTGKSPFNDPDFMQQHNTSVMLPAAQSKQLGQDYTRLSTLVANDHDNKFTQESKDKVASELADAEKNPNGWLGKQFSQLQGTPSGFDDLAKLIKPISKTNSDGTLTTTVPDSSAMKAQAYELSSDPKWNNLKKNRYGIDPEIGDVGSVYDANGKRVWYTNPAAVDHITGEIMANPNDPKNAELYQKANIQPGEPYEKEKLNDLITKQNKGYGQLISDLGNHGNSLVSSKKEVKDDGWDQWLRRYQYEQSHPKKAGAEVLPTERQNVIESMRTNVPGSGEFVSQQVASNPAYRGHNIAVNIDPNNPNIQTITVPPKMKYDAKNDEWTVEKPQYQVKLDAANPDLYQAGANELLNDVTGERIAPTKAFTVGGKGKVPQGLVNPAIKGTGTKKLAKGSLD